MANRIYYASHAVSVDGSTIEGAQSAGITANFTLEQAFQLGKVGIYDNIITDAEAGMSVSKILDGADTIFKKFTGNSADSIANHASTQKTIIISANTDDSDTTMNTSSGKQQSVQITGAYLSSVAYNIPVDGFATEEVSFVGDNKSALATGIAAPTGNSTRATYRQMIATTGFPTEVSGKNVTNISISTDFGREAMYKLGSFNPYFRYANFPFEVSLEFTVANTGVDQTAVTLGGVTATSDGSLPTKQTVTVTCNTSATGSEGLSAHHGYVFTATGCRLSSISQDGGDTGGGNASTTYGYTTYNDLVISG